MIFVTVGSQKFQFNRLLEEIDRLVEENKITEEVYAQIGYSDYRPNNYKYKDFLNRDEFSKIMGECDIVITHGGTGAIINAVKQEKRVIAVSRLKKYKEHVDDHQLQIVSQFNKMGLILGINDVEELEFKLSKLKKMKFIKYSSNTNRIVNNIDKYIKGNQKEDKYG